MIVKLLLVAVWSGGYNSPMTRNAQKKKVLERLDVIMIIVVSIIGLGILGFASVLLWTHAII